MSGPDVDVSFPLLTEDETAEGLNLSTRTLQRFRQQGGGPPYVRLGERRVAYVPADVQTWVRSRVVASTSEATVRAAEEKARAAPDARDNRRQF